MAKRREELAAERGEGGGGESDVEWMAAEVVWEEDSGAQGCCFDQGGGDEQPEDP